jgi:oligoendopeptidase F
MGTTIEGFVDLPTWDLTDLYNNSKDPKIDQDLKTIEKQVDEFALTYTSIALEGTTLLKAIKTYESISEALGKTMTFAVLQYYGDLNNADYRALYQLAQEKVSLLSAKIVFFSLALAKLSAESVANSIKAEPKLAHYDHFLKIVRQYQPHQLSEELERYAVEKSVTGRNAWVRLYDETLASMQLNFEGEMLPLEAVVHKMSDKDADVRKLAAHALNAGLQLQMPLFATITNVLAKDKEIDDKWRHFTKSDSSRHLDNQIEPEVVETLASSVRKNYAQLSHRYYGLKAKMLGMQRLEYWDRNAPLPIDDDADISWPLARKMVLDAYSSFSPTISSIAQEFFDKMKGFGVNITFMGGETADVGDVVRTIAVNGTMTARWPKNKLITNEKITAGNVIVGFASFVVLLVMAANIGFENAKKKKLASIEVETSEPSFAVPTVPMNVSNINVSQGSKGGDHV